MSTVHVFYEQNAAFLYRRVVDRFPVTIGEAAFDENAEAATGWLACLVPNSKPLSTSIPRERRVLCVNEPSAMFCLPVSYINQFGLLISPFRVPGFRGNWFESHTGLPWFFGAKLSGGQLRPSMSLDELRNLQPPAKSDSVSVVLSRKVFHEGHRKRLKLLELLKQQLGDKLLIYGRGINEIEDKADAILPSKYHLAIENTVESSYWTEKLSDSLLGFALPIYGGCRNIHKWLPEKSVLPIDTEDPEGSCNIIRQAIDNDVYGQHLNAILAARQRVLDHETVFHVISRAILAYPAPPVTSTGHYSISPPGKGSFTERIRREARRVFHQLTFHSKLDR